MSREAMKLALEALEGIHPGNMTPMAEEYWNKAITALKTALAEQPAQFLPFGVGGGLVAIKTLLSRDPCVHANTAIQMIDSILAEQPAPVQQEPCAWTRPDSDHMPDTWEASCGAMWTFTEGGPKDNDMHFCPKCGKPAIEAAHGIKENT